MDLSTLEIKKGSRHLPKRVGQGIGSGMGKTSTRGEKGQGARQGRKVPVGFEGGNLPLFRRVPKHGFTNYSRIEYYTINLDILDCFDDKTDVDPISLLYAGVIPDLNKPVKLLGDGKLTKKLNVTLHGFSKSAKEAVEKNGGKTKIETVKETRLRFKQLVIKSLQEELEEDSKKEEK